MAAVKFAMVAALHLRSQLAVPAEEDRAKLLAEEGGGSYVPLTDTAARL